MAGIDSYTVSCLHFQNRVWTFAGTAQIDTAQSKFGIGSLLLDGDSDYISTPDSADWFFDAGDFTIDFWIRFAALPTDGQNLVILGQVEDADAYQIVSIRNTTGTYTFEYQCYNAALVVLVQKEATVAINTWYHVAVVRNGNDYMIFQDGTQIGTTVTDSDPIPDFAGSMYIGCFGGTSDYINGWIDELRITKGLARWTADFSGSLPTAKYADDANTVSLLHFDEADGSTYTKDTAANWTMDGAAQFYDETGKVWTASGNAQLDTAQKKWVASGLFDGTGDYISTPDHADFNMGAGDFTVDMWLRLASTSAGWHIVMVQMGSAYSWINLNRNGSDLNFSISANGSSWDVASAVIIGTLSQDPWYHVAISRSGNNLYYFLDGTKIGTIDVTGKTLMDSTGSLYVGSSGSDYYWDGWIDELRISKGIARWTANFTPPTKEYSSVEVYDIPYLTDTDTPVAPSINHVFPPYLTDTDTPLAPSINHMFPPVLTDTDTPVAPVYNYAFKMSVYATDTDTPVAPYFGQLVPLTAPLVDSDIPYPPTLSGIVIPRRRVKVNLV